MRGTGFWGISYQLVRRMVSVGGQQSAVSNQKEWHSSGRVRRKTAPTGVGVVIPFLKVYIALTAPERTDSQSMLQRTDSQSLLQGGNPDSQSMLQFQSEMV